MGIRKKEVSALKFAKEEVSVYEFTKSEVTTVKKEVTTSMFTVKIRIKEVSTKKFGKKKYLHSQKRSNY